MKKNLKFILKTLFILGGFLHGSQIFAQYTSANVNESITGQWTFRNGLISQKKVASTDFEANTFIANLRGIGWEHYFKVEKPSTRYGFYISNGANAAPGNGWFPVMVGSTEDAAPGLNIVGRKYNGTDTKGRGVLVLEGRLNNNDPVPNEMVAIEFCSGYGRRLAAITGGGVFSAKKIVTQEVIVSADGNTADFVFDDDYNLRDLGEVEAFIKENRHLPDIPKAEIMKAEGVNLAEMNKLLLMKLEELTLYMIRQQKEIDQLKSARNENAE